MTVTAAPPGILQCFVRPSQAKPPVPQFWLGPISLTLVWDTAIIVVSHLYAFPHLPFMVSFFSYILIAIGTLVLDALVSNSFGRNVENLRHAGFSDSITVTFMLSNLITSQLIGYVLMVFVVNDANVFTWKYLMDRMTETPSSTAYILTAVGVNLAITEVLFAAAHRLLHEHPAFYPFHVFHHCSVYSSWNTNTLFHPVDLALEFGGPAISLLLMHFQVWNEDPLILVITYIAFQLWYAYDHAEGLNLYHVYHHRTCNHLYAIYSPFKSTKGALKNKLQHHMRKTYGIKIGKDVE